MIVGLIVVMLIVGLLLWDYGVDQGWITLKYWTSGDKGTRSEVVRNLGLLFVGAAGLFFAIWRGFIANSNARTARQQAAIAEQGQITERFSAAVALLGNKGDATVRVGGIYALGRIARESIELDHVAVMQTLVNFICHSPYAAMGEELLRRYKVGMEKYEVAVEVAIANHGNAEGVDLPTTPTVQECPDIVAALEVIRDRSGEQRAWEERRDYKPSLSGARLMALNLRGVDFTGHELSRAKFDWSNLEDAKFVNADCYYSSYMNSNLSRVFFSFADLREADLRGARIFNGRFIGAKIIAADFTEANLSLANFLNADLLGASLCDATLSHTVFQDADLHGVEFTGAKFFSTILAGAHLEYVQDIAQEQINLCKESEPPENLPAGLTWPFVEKDGKWVKKE